MEGKVIGNKGIFCQMTLGWYAVRMAKNPGLYSTVTLTVAKYTKKPLPHTHPPDKGPKAT